MSTRSRFVGLLLALASIGAGPVADGASWTVPGIVNAGGLNNTHFISDFTVTNPGTAATQVTISFFPSSSPTRTVTLNAGETVVYRNIVESLFGTSGAGALSASSDQPLLLRARTYNTASSGTYGVALPVYEDERLLTPGETGDSLWIRQDASGTSGYRTNIAVVFPDEGGGEAIVTVYDADGNERGSREFSLGAAGFQQVSVASIAGAVPVGRAQIHVTDGRVAGYAVVVDNMTGDSSLFTFEDLPGGRQDVLVNGVARASGRNGTFFRTDARFYNSTDTDATVAVAFHAAGNANPAPATASFTLPAGKIREVVDVLDTLLHVPVGSSGALRFRSDAPVAILCRTSNVDPSGARPGTFGAQQKPVQILSFLDSADAGASITGIRQDASSRTNIGFAAGEEGARYALTLTAAGGATVATTSGSLGANGWNQPNVQDLFPGVAIPADATLRVKVTEGSLDVYDSSIDNASGDPVVTPLRVSPVTIPTSATVGPQGGSIRSDDGRLTLRIPAGALSSSVAASIQTLTSNDAPQGSGSSYAISPGGLNFRTPATLVLRYDSADLDGSSSGALGLAFKSAGLWYGLSGGSVDAAARSLTVPITATAPATSIALSSRRALADPSPVHFTLFRSYAIFPSRKGLSPGSSQDFKVLTVGPSSSQTPGVPPLVLVAPASASDGKYEWYVNEVPSSGNTDGVIHDHGPLAQYKAPTCMPKVNPVLITVKVVNLKGKGELPATATAKVRILPKDWFLSASVNVTLKCPSDFLFAVLNGYGAGRWALLQGTALSENTALPNPAPTTVLGDPTACNTKEIDVKRAGSPEDSLEVKLYDSSYDEDADLFNLSVTLRTKQEITYQVTQKSVAKTYDQLLPLLELTGDFEVKAGQGVVFASDPYRFSYYTVWLKLKPSNQSGCP